MKNLINTLRNSSYNPDFYDSVLDRPLSKGFKFVLGLTAFSILIVILGTLISFYPEVNKFTNSDFIEENYPEGLILTIKDGLLSTNVDNPYVIPIDSEATTTENVITIDTTVRAEELTLGEIKAYNSGTLLTEDSLVMLKNSGEIRVIPLASIGTFTISEEVVQEWMGKLKKWLPLILLGFALLAWIGVTLFCFLGSIVFLILLALIPWAVARVKGRKFTYKNSYNFGLYALGPVIVVDTLFMLLAFITAPFWLTLLIILLIAVVNIRKEE